MSDHSATEPELTAHTMTTDEFPPSDDARYILGQRIAELERSRHDLRERNRRLREHDQCDWRHKADACEQGRVRLEAQLREIRAERDRYREALEAIRDGRWNHGNLLRGLPIQTVREFARQVLNANDR